MKKLLVLLMALVMCLSCFAACTQPGDGNETTDGGNTATLAEAVEYLRSIYKDAAKETPADYDLVGKILIGETAFTVTWTASLESITVKVSEKNSAFYTVDLPVKNETATDYTLTATITDAEGKTETLTFERTLPVYDASAIVSKPEEGVAYKFYMVQATLGQTLFAIGETQDNANKYILTTTDPKTALDFYVEADGEGFKFYTTINGTKTYVLAKTTTSDDGKVSKYIGYSTEEGTTWIYKSETNAWYTTIGGLEYVVGTYNTYNTFSISDSSFMTPDSTGVSQFPGGLMLKEVAEAMTPSEAPTIYETPEEIVNAAYALEPGAVLSGGHKYTLTGVITDIPSPWSDEYGNITVLIVVNDMVDKPIECFRLTGNGANTLAVGDTITVTGEIINYATFNDDGSVKTTKVEFNQGCTLVSIDNSCEHVEEIVPGKDATCTETGLTEGKKCTACGDILVEQTEIPMLAHEEIAIAGKEATCTEAGLTEGKKCTVCDSTLVEQTEIPALDHDWNAVLSQDDDNHWTTCTRCDEIKDKTAHTLGDNGVCGTCGYGCDHANVNEATCTAPGTCKDCGANVTAAKGHTEETVPAVNPTCKDTGLTEGKKCSVCGEILQAQETVAKTEDHTYDNDKDATCNVCGFEREVAQMVVIYYPKENKYMTGTEFFYSGKSKMELTLSENKAEAIAMEQITNADGSVSFKAGDKWLYADNTHVEFVSAEGENTKFAIEETSGGVFIRCFTANFSGKPQYLEIYGGYMTVYGMGADASIYTFVLQDADGASGTVTDDANTKVDGNSTPGTPSNPSAGITGGVTSVATDKSYKLAGVNASGQIYFDGTLTSGRINGNATGVTVKLEAGAAAGEYYIYFMNGSTKTYIGVDSSASTKTAAFVLSTEKNDACVWLVDASAKTIISKSFSGRGIATQAGSSYSNFSSYATSNFGQNSDYGVYTPVWFVAA